MTIAIISTLISSIALAGVVISLLLQTRQLRVSRLQAARAAQLELMKIGLDNPSMATATLGISDPDLFVKQTFLNWHIKYLELSYEINVISASAVRQVAKQLFEAQTPREWWSWNRQTYESDTMTRRTKQFFAIVDGEFQRLNVRSTSAPNAPSS